MVKSKKIAPKIEKPVWLKMTEDELRKLILELSEKYQPAQIGIILRDQYGVPTTKVFNKKLSVYLKEIGKDDFYDMKNVEKKIEKLRDHIGKNVTDKKAKHKFQKANSKLMALRKYSERRKK